ncbi:hypothetical protein D3C78_1548200 [compost metagenome]
MKPVLNTGARPESNRLIAAKQKADTVHCNQRLASIPSEPESGTDLLHTVATASESMPSRGSVYAHIGALPI